MDQGRVQTIRLHSPLHRPLQWPDILQQGPQIITADFSHKCVRLREWVLVLPPHFFIQAFCRASGEYV